MTGSVLYYQQEDSVKLQCEIDLKKLFIDSKERDRFDKNWEAFLESDPCNKQIFKLRGNKLIYHSEHLLPTEKDDRPPLLLVFGNPASHSVAAGMFFSFKDNRKENRLWKSILKPVGVLNFSFDENLPAAKLNALRKKQMLKLDYETPFRIGLSVFISLPSAPSGPYGGVAGVRKLLGVRALRRLEAEESKRIIKCAKDFIGDDPCGKVVTFQKKCLEWLEIRWRCFIQYRRCKKRGIIRHLKRYAKYPLTRCSANPLIWPLLAGPTQT